MDQDDTMDFKALRAKFQEEDLLMKQPRLKPALPEKPKVVSPPSSPTHYLPAGARPSLLTSINHTYNAPRVVFKDEKKESKKPLIQNNSKGKEKSEGKQKKEKRISSVFSITPKENTTELVPATPPPKITTLKKKGFLGFRKSLKSDSGEVPSDGILDAPSPSVSGSVPLIPVPSDFGDSLTERAISFPNIPSAAVEVTPPSVTPVSPEITPPPAFIPAVPGSETPLQIETPALPVSKPASQNDLGPPSTVPTPPPRRAAPRVAPTPSPPPTEPPAEARPDIEAIILAAVEKPPTPAVDRSSNSPSPSAERSVSALSMLERAEELSPAKRTVPCDQRIFNLLQKARRKTPSTITTPTSSYSITPPPEEFPPSQSPTPSSINFPPIDYEAGKLVNGLDHRQASLTEDGIDPIPELLVVPPPPQKKVLPDPESLGPAPEKPDRPPSVNLSQFIPPPPIEDYPGHADFSETDTTDILEFNDVTSDAHSPELPVSEWGNGDYTGPNSPDGQTTPDLYSNRITFPGVEDRAALAYGDNPLPESIFPVPPESTPHAGILPVVGNGIYESTENVYEDITASATKKKIKTDGKKRKGPPKNPYVEASQETNEEKSKTGRFSKNDKKVAAELPDEKELKKKEKQRLEKEKKEQKEKQEREKKEQKEREKKENEIKKKFKLTGQEDAMYEAKVTVTNKGRKNDLPVNSGDVISIIRTTNCPKGKWLARDSSNNYGYVAVDHVELDIQEMLALGKKAAISRKTNNNNNGTELDGIGTGSRASNHFPLSEENFTDDDSEEWTGDDDEPLSPSPNMTDPLASLGHSRTLSMPDMGNKDLNVNHQHSRSDISPDGTQVQARHEALHKLATFFHSPKPVEPAASTVPETSPVEEEAAPVPEAESNTTEEVVFDPNALLILPPPDLYA
ncbi:FYN-binding protein 1 isoform X2 [Labrus mixtus]|uniref:FYN-binding protein 1 isoform X2 n=1 Tax=Labrus mixtus TaxID=508554 RepID=UPI0029C020DF|nr:FYN-binding protein 1 isoform X2 [Labrus mixtus]